MFVHARDIKMDEFVDSFAVCLYCGDLMEYPNERQQEVFGKPFCCEFDMLQVEREKLHGIVRSLDTFRKNLEEELLKGVL